MPELRGSNVIALTGFVTLCFAVAAAGGAATAASVGTWYAGALFAPYAAWVGFAAVLNTALWRLN